MSHILWGWRWATTQGPVVLLGGCSAGEEEDGGVRVDIDGEWPRFSGGSSAGDGVKLWCGI